MSWTVTYVSEFARWLRRQSEAFREDLMAYVIALEDQGPQLGRPHCDRVEGSRFVNMKELRVQHRGDPYRVLFAFDLHRQAVLLVGGNKRGDARWYEKNIPIADSRFEDWQEQFDKPGRKRRRGRGRKGR
jgi:hypothetical protein